MIGVCSDFVGQGKKPYHGRADFNADRLADDAYIALTTKGSNWVLFLNLNSKESNPQIVKLCEDLGKTLPQNMRMSVSNQGDTRRHVGRDTGLVGEVNSRAKPETSGKRLSAI